MTDEEHTVKKVPKAVPSKSPQPSSAGGKGKGAVAKSVKSRKVKVQKSKKVPSKKGQKAVKAASKKADKKKVEGEDEEEEVEIIEDEEELEEEEKVHKAKLKPKLTKSQKKLLKIRKQRKQKQPTFRRQEWFRYKRLGDSWRKPRGLHSKMRKNLKYRPNMARIGYGSPKLVRGRHPSGFEEVMVCRPRDLEGMDPKNQAARISHKVGTRKRIAIEDKADELGIRILNRGST
jgi:large subunit ribosomal protein L32e